MPADPFERVAGLTRGESGWVPEPASVVDRPLRRTPDAWRAVPVRVIASAVACGVLVVILLLGRGALSEAGAVETVPARQTAGATAIGSSGQSPTTSAGPSSSLPPGLAGLASGGPTGQPDPVVVVHIAGQVRRPGLVTLPASGRLADAIRAAGGAAPGAAQQRLNLARHLVDGEKVVVPGPHDPVSDGPGTADPAGWPDGTAALGGTGGLGGAGPVDLNSATQAQLEELPGIGPVTASAIIGWRTAHQRFTWVEELGEVDGIGPKTLERLRPLVRV